jgi:hypothetical protein
MQASLIPENFFQTLYPASALPPLWEVIYQEAVRGHHLLFNRRDVELFDTVAESEAMYDDVLSAEIEIVVLKVMACSELGDMVKVIDAQPYQTRRSLFAFYKRSLWLWSNYVKSQLN